MARANEFVGMMAGGSSLRRLALPLFVGCTLLGVATFTLRNVAGPAFVRSEHADVRRIRGSEETLGKSLSVQGYDTPGRSGAPRAVIMSLEEFVPSTSSGRGFAAQVIEAGEPLIDVRAPVAVWSASAGGWRFPEGGTRWQYGPAIGKPSERVECFYTSLDPDLLEVEELGAGVLSLGGLWRQRARPQFASELHERLAQTFVPLVLALAALPFVLTADRSRVFQGTVLAILVVGAYETLARTMVSAAGAGYVPAFLGGWLAPVVFAGFGAWRMAKLRT